LITSPVVRAEVEAVRKLPAVAVEEAETWPVVLTEKTVRLGATTDRVPPTLRVLSMVEEARTKMPAVVEVGVRAVSAKIDCQAPDEPTPQAPAAVVTTDEPLSSRHLEAVRLFKVKESVMVTAPLNRELPTTPRVVVGTGVPIPTKLSLAFTTREPESRFKPVFKVVVAVAESGIWKMAVPESVTTLKMLPVRLLALTTSLITSPVVRAEVEAVRKFWAVTELLAETKPPSPILKTSVVLSKSWKRSLVPVPLLRRNTVSPVVVALAPPRSVIRNRSLPPLAMPKILAPTRKRPVSVSAAKA